MVSRYPIGCKTYFCVLESGMFGLVMVLTSSLGAFLLTRPRQPGDRSSRGLRAAFAIVAFAGAELLIFAWVSGT